MNLQKLQQKRKGISPIIATLLLILIAIAAGVVVYAYVMGFSQNAINQNGNGQVAESLDIAVLTHNLTAITAYVQNTGTNSINITGLYIYDTSGVAVYANSSIFVTIAAGSTGLVAASNGLSPPPGSSLFVGIYQVKVVTSRGNTAITNLQKV